MDVTALLAAESVSYTVGRARLLHEVSFEAAPGDFLAILGPNGAGKSTLVRLLSGEASPSAGEIHIEGRPVGDVKAVELARLRAVLPQHAPTTFPFTTREVVGFARTPWLHTAESGDDEDAVEEAMSLTGVAPMASQPFPTLSGGEQTLVSLARVLAQRTPLLLLDEPTNALDLRRQALVMDLLRDMADRGQAVIAVLHDLNLAATHATSALLLREGEVAAWGAPDDVLTSGLLSDVFEYPVRVLADPAGGGPLILPERRVHADMR